MSKIMIEKVILSIGLDKFSEIRTAMLENKELSEAQKIEMVIELLKESKKKTGLFKNISEAKVLAAEIVKFLADPMNEVITSLYKEVSNEVMLSINSDGFIEAQFGMNRKQNFFLPDESFNYLNPSGGEMKEMSLHSNIDIECDQKGYIFTGEGENTASSDILDSVVTSVDKLLNVNSKTETEKIEIDKRVCSFYPDFRQKEYAVRTTHHISSFIDTETTNRWLRMSTSEMIKGSKLDFIDMIFPLDLPFDQLLGRARSLSRLLADSFFIQKIYNCILDGKYLKGRTQYNQRKILFSSRIIEDINSVLSTLSRSDRYILAIPILALTLRELNNTGLLEEDFSFFILKEKPIKVSHQGIIPKLLLINEIKSGITMYFKSIDSVEYGSMVVDPYDIAQKVVKLRRPLVEDLANLEYITPLYDNLKIVAGSIMLQIPSKLTLLHPTLKNDSVIKEFSSIYDFVVEVIETGSNLKVALASISYEQILETINWFKLRLASVKDYVYDLEEIKNRVSVLYRLKKNGNFSNVIICEDYLTQHEVMLGNFTKYGKANAYSVYKKRRQSLEKKLNGTISNISNSLSGENFFKLMLKEINSGHLPAYLGITNASDKWLDLLAINLNNGNMEFGYDSLANELDTSLSDADNASTMSIPVIPLDATRVYSMSTEQLKVGNTNFISPEIVLSDVKTYLWLKIQALQFQNFPKKDKKVNLAYLDITEGGRAILPFEAKPKSIDGRLDIAVTLEDKVFKYSSPLKALMVNELVVNSSIIPRYNGSVNLSMNLLTLLFIKNLELKNLTSYNEGRYVRDDDYGYYCLELLEKIFNGNGEIKAIANKIIAYMEIQISVNLGQGTSELDILSMIQLKNEVVVQVMISFAEATGAIATSLLFHLLDHAKKTRAWYDKEWFN